MGDESAPALRLAADQAAGHAPTRYAAKLADYVPIYKRQLRVIKRWIEKGRAAKPPELPPLDDPEAMLTWWPRHMEWKVPDDLFAAAAASRARRPAATTPPSPSQPTPLTSEPTTAYTPPHSSVEAALARSILPASASTPPATAASSAPRSSVVLGDDLAGLTLADAMPRLQRVLAHALRDYETKASDPNADDASINLASNRLDKFIERHRKLETTLIESAQKRGDLIPVLELRPQLAAIFARLSGTLVDHLVATLAIERSAAVACVDTWFSQVRGLPFGDTAQLPPEARAA